MIYFRCTDDITDEYLNGRNVLLKNLFFEFTRLVNLAGGYPTIYDVEHNAIRCMLKYLHKGEILKFGFPQTRLDKIITVLNASYILKQSRWPVVNVRDIIEGKTFSIIDIEVDEAGAATFQRHVGKFFRLDNILLKPHRIEVKEIDSDNTTQEPETNLQHDHLQQVLESLGLDVSQIDLAEMQRLVEKRAQSLKA